jgi:hypothetical protein
VRNKKCSRLVLVLVKKKFKKPFWLLLYFSLRIYLLVTRPKAFVSERKREIEREREDSKNRQVEHTKDKISNNEKKKD